MPPHKSEHQQFPLVQKKKQAHLQYQQQREEDWASWSRRETQRVMEHLMPIFDAYPSNREKNLTDTYYNLVSVDQWLKVEFYTPGPFMVFLHNEVLFVEDLYYNLPNVLHIFLSIVRAFYLLKEDQARRAQSSKRPRSDGGGGAASSSQTTTPQRWHNEALVDALRQLAKRIVNAFMKEAMFWANQFASRHNVGGNQQIGRAVFRDLCGQLRRFVQTVKRQNSLQTALRNWQPYKIRPGVLDTIARWTTDSEEVPKNLWTLYKHAFDILLHVPSRQQQQQAASSIAHLWPLVPLMGHLSSSSPCWTPIVLQIER